MIHTLTHTHTYTLTHTHTHTHPLTHAHTHTPTHPHTHTQGTEVDVPDIKKVYSLFIDVKRSTQFLQDYQATHTHVEMQADTTTLNMHETLVHTYTHIYTHTYMHRRSSCLASRTSRTATPR